MLLAQNLSAIAFALLRHLLFLDVTKSLDCDTVGLFAADSALQVAMFDLHKLKCN
jgi:hypothetical protein